MSRLASFRGPSTPHSSPVPNQPNSPCSPSRIVESTFHRKTRTYLQELRGISKTWNDLVLHDGLKCIQAIVDGRTDLENALVLIPDRRPRTHLVGPQVMLIEKRLQNLDAVVVKLQRQFRRMNMVVESMEALAAEAHKNKGWKWVHEEPLWVTWSLEKFVISIRDILVPYHRSLDLHTKLAEKLVSHSLSFENARDIIAKWVEQPWLEDAGWEAKWEDLCAVEVERWDKSP